AVVSPGPTIWPKRKAIISGAAPAADNRVRAFKSSCLFSRPGNFPITPPQDGIWHISSGDGIVPWNNPAPARITTLRLVPSAYENPARGSKFFSGLLMAAFGQVSPSHLKP